MMNVETIIAAAQERKRTRVRLVGSLPAPPRRRKLREAAGLTVVEVASVIGVTKWMTYAYERGSATPSGERLAKYVALLERLSELEGV